MPLNQLCDAVQPVQNHASLPKMLLSLIIFIDMNQYRIVRAFSVFICIGLLMFSACAKKEVVRQTGPEPYEGQVDAGVLKNNIGFRDINTVKALTDVRVFRHGEPVASFSGVFGYRSPGSVRTSFFGPFGLTVMDMLFTPELLQVHLPSKGTLYEMESPDIAFSALKDNGFSYSMQSDDEFHMLDAFRASDTGASPAVRYYFDRKYLLNRRIVVFREGIEFVSVDFDRFNGRLPEMTRLAFAKGLELEIVFQEPEYNSEIPVDYFRKIGHEDNRILPFQDLLRRFAPSR